VIEFYGARLARFIFAGWILTASFASSAAAQEKPVIVGGTLGLTGIFSEASADYKAVYDLWLSQVNKKGGLLGRPVAMTIYNDESSPTVAQTLYNRLLDQDKVDLVLAPFSTLVGGAIVPLVRSHNKLLFNGGFPAINVFKNSKGWMIGSYTYQEPDYTRGLFDLVKSLPANERPKRLAIVTAQNPFPLVIRDGVAGQGGTLNHAKEAGIPVVLNEQYPPNTTDFTGLVQKAKSANADMLLVLGLPNDTLQIARTVHQLGFKPAIFCTCAAQVTTLASWDKLGSAAEGAFGSISAWPTQDNNGLAELTALFKGRGQNAPTTFAIASYVILQVLEQAVQGANTLDQDKLREYILKSEFNTAAGTFRYQEDGTPVFSQIVLQFLKGKNEIVWPENLRTASPVVSAQ